MYILAQIVFNHLSNNFIYLIHSIVYLVSDFLLSMPSDTGELLSSFSLELFQQFLLVHLHVHLLKPPSLIHQVSVFFLMLLVLVNENHEDDYEDHC
jgi:hypothetical protein